jgi:hypothetical protein
VKLQLGGDLLEELLDPLLLEGIDDHQPVTGANEQVDLFEKIGWGHWRQARENANNERR